MTACDVKVTRRVPVTVSAQSLGKRPIWNIITFLMLSFCGNIFVPFTRSLIRKQIKFSRGRLFSSFRSNNYCYEVFLIVTNWSVKFNNKLVLFAVIAYVPLVFVDRKRFYEKVDVVQTKSRSFFVLKYYGKVMKYWIVYRTDYMSPGLPRFSEALIAFGKWIRFNSYHQIEVLPSFHAPKSFHDPLNPG